MRRPTVRRQAMIFALSATFLAAIAGIFYFSGGSLAVTVAIVLGWLAAGLTVGFLMARSR